MKRFACQDIIPGCQHVFTGADDQSVLDQVIAHAAADHGLLKPPLALVELVVASTRTFTPSRPRGHLRLVGSHPSQDLEVRTDAAGGEPGKQPSGQLGQQPASNPGLPAFPERVAAAIPIQRRRDAQPNPESAGDGLRPIAATASDATEHRPRPVHDSYRHECMFYSGVDGFLKEVIPFILDGLALDQPVMVAVAEPRLSAVRTALGDDARLVVLLDMAELGANPASIIPAWRDFVTGTHGRPVRGVGEPIWAGRRTVEIVESQLHEALLNVAVDADTPLWLLCPYDITALDPAILDEAQRSHPFLVGAKVSGTTGMSVVSVAADADFTPHARELFAAELPEPVESPVTTMGQARAGSDVATLVFDAATAAGLPAQRSAKLAAAVDEVANAGTRNSGAAVSIRLWQDQAALVCEVGDHGTIDDLLVGRGAALSTRSRDRGIRLANELCDLVQVRSNSSGTTVRMHSWL